MSKLDGCITKDAAKIGTMHGMQPDQNGPISARENELRKAAAINALLLRPIGVLPAEAGDTVRPVSIGFFQSLREILKPDATPTALRRAIAAYVHSKRYYLACAQPNSMRHDIDGNSVEPISDADRQNAQKTLQTFRRKNNQSEAPAHAAPPVPAAQKPSKQELIRASLLGGLRPRKSAKA